MRLDDDAKLGIVLLIVDTLLWSMGIAKLNKKSGSFRGNRDPATVVALFFDAYQDGDADVLDAHLSGVGHTKMQVSCDGEGLDCLHSHDVSGGRLRNRRAEIVLQDEGNAVIKPGTTWRESEKLCQVYELIEDLL